MSNQFLKAAIQQIKLALKADGIDPVKSNEIMQKYNKIVEIDRVEQEHADVMVNCMIQFFGVDLEKALTEVKEYREIAGDMFTHDEAFYVACDLAGIHDDKEQIALMAKHEEAYREILGY